MRNSRFYIWSRMGLTFLVLMAVTFSTTPVQARSPSDTTLPAFSDGKWAAKFSIHAVAPTKATTLTINYLGDMQFNSSGGSLDGEWLMTGKGIFAGDITGTAAVSSGGKVEGSSADPQLTTKNFIMNLNINAYGTATNTQVDLGSGAQLGLTLTKVTCSQATADIAAPAVANYQSAGINANVTGSFTAIRVGDLLPSAETNYMDEVGNLIDEAETLKQNAVTGNGIDYDKLDELLTKADDLNLGLKKNISCGFGGNKTYLTVITDVIANLAGFALQNPQLFTTEELSRLAFAAVNAGVMGSGASNAQQAAELKEKFVQELSNRLGDAQTNKGCQDAVQIQITAGLLGDSNLKQQAKSVVDAVC